MKKVIQKENKLTIIIEQPKFNIGQDVVVLFFDGDTKRHNIIYTKILGYRMEIMVLDDISFVQKVMYKTHLHRDISEGEIFNTVEDLKKICEIE